MQPAGTEKYHFFSGKCETFDGLVLSWETKNKS